MTDDTTQASRDRDDDDVTELMRRVQLPGVELESGSEIVGITGDKQGADVVITVTLR